MIFSFSGAFNTFTCSLATVLLCACLSGAQTPTNIHAEFMPGSSPAYPNQVLVTCMSKARAKARLDVTRQGKHAEEINEWCS